MKSVKRRLALALVVVLALYALFVAITSGGVQRGRPEPPVVAGDAPSVADAAASLAPASAPAEPERVPVRVEATPDDAPAAPLPLVELGPREGLLQVRVVALETKGPVAGAIVQLETPSGGLLGLASVERARGTWLERLVTDSYGRADFRVPSGQPFVVHVRPELPPGRSARLAVRPLEPNDYRTAILGVFTDPKRSWCARVVDGMTGLGLAAARIHFASGFGLSLVEARTDAAGGVCLELGAAPVSLTVEADGYGTAIVEAADPSTTGEVIALLPLAALDLVLRTTDGRPIAGAQARAWELPVRDTPPRKGRTDAEGRVSFDGMPAGRRLAIAAMDDQLLRAEELVLNGGERLALVWILGERGSVSGTVNDEHGRSVQGVRLRLLSASTSNTAASERAAGDITRREDYPPELVRLGLSDSEGRFRFPDVPAGEWILASVSAMEELRRVQASTGGRALGAEAQDLSQATAVAPAYIAVGEGEDLELYVPAWRGLAIRGELARADVGSFLAPRFDLDPLAGILVNARGVGFEASALTRASGEFEIGPLVPGEYELFAEVKPGREWRLAGVRAGTDGIVLKPSDVPAR